MLTVDNTAVVLAGSDLLDARGRHANWRFVPLYVELGGRSYRDGVDLMPEDFYRLLRVEGGVPHTSQPSPADFETAFGEARDYEHIVVITISDRMSGTYESARIAVESSGVERVILVDAGMVSGALVLLGEALQRRLASGTTEETVRALGERFRREARYLVVLDTLEYLIRGGRARRVPARAGQLANIKPLLQIVAGEVVPLARKRGRARSLAALEQIFDADAPIGPGLRVGVAHAEAAPEAEHVAGRVAALRPGATLEFFGPFGPAVGAHSGPGAVALFWFGDDATPS